MNKFIVEIEEPDFDLALKNYVFHSINDVVYRECKVSLTMCHALFLDGRIGLNALQACLRHRKERL
jgi:hypothetical protein